MNNTFSHALTLHNACRLEEAEILYKKILEIDQNHFDALHMLGVLLTDQDAIQAIALLSRAVENKPHEPMPLSNLANALLKIEQYPLALGLCDHCLLIEPKFWRAHANRAVALMGMGQHADAIIGLTQAIEIEPGVSALWSNRGNAYEAIDQFESALNDHNQAIQLNPHFVDAYNNRGHLLIGLKRYEQASQSLDQAIVLNPIHADAHFNKAVLQLLHGEFESGWNEYEWRWRRTKQESPYLETSKPLWDYQTGSDSNDKCLLIWSEQGVGDHVFFASLLSFAKKYVKKLIVKVDARLIPIFQRSMPEIEFVPSNQTLEENLYDCHLPMASLCRFFYSELTSHNKRTRGYLFADQDRARNIRTDLNLSSESLLIGISWSSKNSKSGRARTISLIQLARALSVDKKIKLINLQYGDVSTDLLELKESYGVEVLQCATVDNMNDLDGLASLIDVCDLVVSSDNSTVHLAGALGKQVWVCLPDPPNWRWGLSGDSSDWYPNVRLYRQQNLGDWTSVLLDLSQSLMKYEN